MRNFALPLLLAAALPLGGCAFVPFAPVLADAVNSARQPRTFEGQDLAAAGAEACRARAARFGRVNITGVQPVGTDVVQVSGTIDGTRGFVCNFNRDGRITGYRGS